MAMRHLIFGDIEGKLDVDVMPLLIPVPNSYQSLSYPSA
jgi:hypothetical protein